MKLDEKQRPGLAGAALGNSGRFAAVMILLSVLLLVALILNVNIGSVSIPTGEILKKVGAAVGYGIGNLFTGGGFSQQLQEVMKGTTQSQILFSIRIPRMLLAAVLGGALSVSGYLLQVFFRNPIAGPFVLGISSGAKMVVGITLIFLAPLSGQRQLGDAGAGGFYRIAADHLAGAGICPEGAQYVHAAGHRHHGGLYLRCGDGSVHHLCR